MKALILSTLVLALGLGCSQKTTMSRPIPTQAVAAAQTQNLSPEGSPIPGDEPTESVTKTDEAAQASTETAVTAFERQVGFQRRVILEEKEALNKAIENRNNEVRLGQDLLNVLAYGVSTGVLTWDFLRRTGNLNATRAWVNKRVPSMTPPPEPIRSPAAEAAIAAEGAAKTTAQGSLLKKLGSAAFKTTEAVSAAALGVVLVGDVFQVGKDISIRFSDSDEIKMHKAKLEEAERNLDAADQNLQAAILSARM